MVKVPRVTTEKRENKSSISDVDESRGYFLLAKKINLMIIGQMESEGGQVFESGTIGRGFVEWRNEIQTIVLRIGGKDHSFHRTTSEEINEGNTVISSTYHFANAYAVSVRRTQGMTLDTIIIDTSKGLPPTLGYTSLGRVRCSKDVYITKLPWKLKHIISIDLSIAEAFKDQPLFVFPEQPIIQIEENVPEAVCEEIVEASELSAAAGIY